MRESSRRRGGIDVRSRHHVVATGAAARSFRSAILVLFRFVCAGAVATILALALLAELHQLPALLRGEDTSHLEQHPDARLPERGAGLLDLVDLRQDRRLGGLIVAEQGIERGPLLLDVGLHVLERLAVPREHVLQPLDLVIGELEPVPDLVPPPELPVVHPPAARPVLVSERGGRRCEESGGECEQAQLFEPHLSPRSTSYGSSSSMSSISRRSRSSARSRARRARSAEPARGCTPW